jgi:hypothetical protein
MDLQSRFLGVARDDLIVLEDGVEQKIDTFRGHTISLSTQVSSGIVGVLALRPWAPAEALRACAETAR